MKLRLAFLGFAFAFGLSLPAFAATAAPADSTGQCKDGSYTTMAKKKGACSGHGGVKAWYGKAGAKGGGESSAKSKASRSKSKAKETPASGASAKGSASEMPSARSEMPTAASGTAAPRTPTRASPKGASASSAAAGQVWVNKPTKVYHCAGDRWYGKTKDGAYMSESQAKAEGYRPDHGKACAG